MGDGAQRGGRTLLDMNGYQWTVLFAAWLGWGFDVFDGLLFNYVAPNCVPTLLGIPLGTKEAAAAALNWTGILTSVLLLGWAVGGVVFGWIADRLGRTRTLLLTMLLYAFGTAACAFAPNIEVLLLCRIVASLGIGGEWAAGASMVAEVVPEKRRVEAGALLYTSAPLGLFLATYVTWAIAHNAEWISTSWLGTFLASYGSGVVPGVTFGAAPEQAWRYVFLCGLIPAAVAFVVRWFVEEPERWQHASAGAPPSIAELFTPEFRSRTLSGLGMAITALLMWWSCNAFIPVVASGLAAKEAGIRGLDPAATGALKESWKAIATNSFNLGGLIGTLATVPISKAFGRRVMFGAYFLASAVAILATFGLDLPGETRLYMYFGIGLTVFGVFGSFTYYLPELYPTRLRGTGAGFCYNAGRVIAAAGPFVVGSIAASGADSLSSALAVLFWVGVIPLLGLLLLPWVRETKGLVLAD